MSTTIEPVKLSQSARDFIDEAQFQTLSSTAADGKSFPR